METARALFILLPAALVGTVVALADPVIGMVAFFTMCILGVDVTEARPERGEGWGG